MFVAIEGTFYRSVQAEFASQALSGSTQPGRYSRTGEPSLYLSSSREGVAAAMIAHTKEDAPVRSTLSFDVRAERILDLRDADACRAAGIDPAAAAADWQDLARQGKTPPSWRVADQARALGANGLIDPSRKAPALWHLVLFRWNVPSGPSVRAIS